MLGGDDASLLHDEPIEILTLDFLAKHEVESHGIQVCQQERRPSRIVCLCPWRRHQHRQAVAYATPRQKCSNHRAHVARRGNRLVGDHPLARPSLDNLLLAHEILRRRQTIRRRFLVGRQRLLLRRTLEIGQIHHDISRAMVIKLDHLAFVQRHICGVAGSHCRPPMTRRNRVTALGLQILALHEVLRVVGHVEHLGELHRPNPFVGQATLRLTLLAMPHQHRVFTVDAQREVGITPGAEDRRRAGVRVDQRKVVLAQHQQALALVQLGQAVQEEGAARLRKGPLRPAKHQRAELEAGMDIGKKHLLVLEVEQGAEPAGGRDALEKRRRAFVRRNAAGRQQGHQPIRPHQALRALDKQAVEVDIAAAQQRIVARFGQHPGMGLGTLHGALIVGPQRRLFTLQLGDQALAVGRTRLVGNRRLTLGKPLHLLQLDAVPGRVAQHHIKAAAAIGRKHRGEGRPPVEKIFTPGQLAAARHQCIGLARARAAARQLALVQQLHQVAPG